MERAINIKKARLFAQLTAFPASADVRVIVLPPCLEAGFKFFASGVIFL